MKVYYIEILDVKTSKIVYQSKWNEDKDELRSEFMGILDYLDPNFRVSLREANLTDDNIFEDVKDVTVIIGTKYYVSVATTITNEFEIEADSLRDANGKAVALQLEYLTNITKYDVIDNSTMTAVTGD